MKLDAQVTIIGAGVIGLAISYYLTKKNIKSILIEKKENYGLENSSKNSQVIHAGIYYGTNSLKKKLSIRGKKLIYHFCKNYNVPFKKNGKLFIALKDTDIDLLNELKEQGNKNGINDLKLLNINEVKKIEPNLHCKYALYSPSSGVLDVKKFMSILYEKSKNNGLEFFPNTELYNAKKISGGWSLDLRGDIINKINSKYVINSSGINSTKIAKHIFENIKFPLSTPIKGSYLKCKNKNLLNHIIYTPMKPGHIYERVDATPLLNGELIFGPSLELDKNFNDEVNPELISRFYKTIKQYIPELKENDLENFFSGMRAKIDFENNKVSDFIINNLNNSNWINLFGIESPGLTASLAIAEYVYDSYFVKNL